MATPRGPRGFSSNRPSAAAPRVYEKYTPSFEWKQEKESDILLIFLPDFLKQNIRVRTETGNILRVTGERPLGGNKLSRFQQDFEIPNNCIIKAIRAKFEGGILTITFPRIPITTTTPEKPIIGQPVPQLPPVQKQDRKEPTESAVPRKTALPTPVLNEPSPRTTQTAVPRETALPSPVLKEPTAQTTEAAVPRKTALPSPVLKEPTPRTPALPSPGLNELERSRFQTPSPPKPANASTTDADLPKEPRKFIESSRPPLVVDDKTPLLPTLGTGKGTVSEEALKGKDGLKTEKTEKNKEAEMHQDGFTKRAGIEKLEDVQTQGTKEHNEKDKEEASNKIVKKTGELDLKEAMKNVGRRVTEEKGLVVNMGAAVMVIVGLGAYAYHSFSSGKLAKR